MLQEMEAWMENRKFRALDDFRGRMSQMQSDNPELYERLQYIRALVGLE
jgi:dihydroorotate dehydrogenase (fumarate)